MLKLEKLLPIGTCIAFVLTSGIALASTPKNTVQSTTAYTETKTQTTTTAEAPKQTIVLESAQSVTTDALTTRDRLILASRGTERDPNAIIGTTNDDNSNVRNYPDTDHDVIASLYKDVDVTITGTWNDWFKIKTQHGTVGWIHKKLLDLQTSDRYQTLEAMLTAIPSEKPKSVPPSVSQGQKIVESAKKYLGVRYVWGGTSPKGFDCSGLVQYVYAKYGVYLNRVAADQATQGTKVKMANLKPGDLVFFDTNGGHNYINHVGIYIGDGNFIEASSGSNYRVIITDMSGGFYARNFMTARRIFN
jgi:N-acetylmuramoyl-L-alanine amidase